MPWSSKTKLLYTLIALSGLGAGLWLALSATDSPSLAEPPEPTRALKAFEGGPAAAPEPVRLLPRRPRAEGDRLGAAALGERPHDAVGEGLPERAWPTCPVLARRRTKPLVYGVGSSTMGGLAKVLGAELSRDGVKMRKWAKAGSGLARPDFHDWPAMIPEVIRDHDPDVFVVVLGTNDNQAVRDATTKAWFRPGHAKWEPTYRGRIRSMLRALNRSRPRWVFWIGPNLIDRRASRTTGKRINRMMREEVGAWKGDAWFIDLYSLGSSADGKLRVHLSKPGGGTYRLRGKDGIHLLYSGLRWALAEPVLKRLRPCLGGDPGGRFVPGPRPRREFHLEQRNERRAP